MLDMLHVSVRIVAGVEHVQTTLMLVQYAAPYGERCQFRDSPNGGPTVFSRPFSPHDNSALDANRLGINGENCVVFL
jgi:hypothetical protein